MKTRNSFLFLVAIGTAVLSFGESRDHEAIRSFSGGIAGRPSLLLRSRHVDKVQVSGSGTLSKHGYSEGPGLLSEALWMSLRNQGVQGWASAVVHLEKNLNVARYNTMLVWVKANEKPSQLMITVRDRTWTRSVTQGKVGPIRVRGVPGDPVVQIAVPFRAFASASPIDFSQLSRIGFEFGRDSAGNPLNTNLNVVGMAFVDQSPAATKVSVLYSGAPQSVRVEKPAPVKQRLDPAPKKVLPAERAPNKVVVPEAPVLEPDLSNDVEVLPPVDVAMPVVKPLIQEAPPLVLPRDPFRFPIPGIAALSASSLIFALGFIGYARRRKRKAATQFGKIFHDIRWPFVTAEPSSDGKAERLFWKELARKNVQKAWLSPYQVHLDQSHCSGEIYGEDYLRRQIRLAGRAGVHVMPSVCFARTIFQLDGFLANPSLYVYKHVLPAELTLSDEELRVKHIGFFPVWVPPFWQRKHALPQKLLVAYGKLPGVMPTSDSVQFNLTSPDLRKLAVSVIERFAQEGVGVRIEGAAALLNASIHLYYGNMFGEVLPKTEFWADVISTVKRKYPDFIFVADGASTFARQLSTVGFDYFQNDQLTNVLINQIRLEDAGRLETLLTPEYSQLLRYSIFDVSTLLRTTLPGSSPRQQTLLSCMLLGLMPGIIQHDGQIPWDLNQFFQLVHRSPVIRFGDFSVLPSSQSDVFCFVRWEGRVAHVVAANFSPSRRDVSVRMNLFAKHFDSGKFYLFSDLLHGATLLKQRQESAEAPAVAILGDDLIESGLGFSVGGLSLRLFSVNLAQPVSHESHSKVRQLR